MHRPAVPSGVCLHGMPSQDSEPKMVGGKGLEPLTLSV